MSFDKYFKFIEKQIILTIDVHINIYTYDSIDFLIITWS